MKYKRKIKWILSSALFLLSPFLYAAELTHNLLAVGSYLTTSKNYESLPLMAMSNNEGKTWSYFSKVEKLPFDSRIGDLHTVSCNGDFCVAAGNYQHAIESQEEKPLIAVSRDKGNSWSYVITQPDDYVFGLNWGGAHSSCNDQFCAIASSYYTKDKKWLPFLTISNDKGQTWTYPESIISNLPNKSSFYNGLYSINCSNQLCIATGASGSVVLGDDPLIAVSKNQGASWTYSSLPSDVNKDAAIYNATCTETFCLAVGAKNKQTSPVILTSKDQGATWSSVKNIPSEFKKGLFFNIHCPDNNTCIIVGSTDKSARQMLPLIAITANAGATWTYPPSIQTNLPADLLWDNLNSLSAVTCTNRTCIVGGSGSLTGYKKVSLLLAVSQDKGINWSYIDIKSLQSKKEILSATVDKISCKQTTCVATGNYRENTGEKFPPVYPFLITSQDSGITWTMPDTIMSERPKNLVIGFFQHSLSDSKKLSQQK